MTSIQVLKSALFLSGALLLLSCNKDDQNDPTEENAKYPTLTGANPIVVAHRGASGYLPEHTIEGYTKAIEMGADFIEPDLVMTKDGQLVVRHEPMLSGTTNVADIPAFASKKTTKNLDGAMVTDWFVCDFTLAEIKQLKAKQAFAERSQQYNNLYSIPTFAEVIALAKQKSVQTGRVIGIYP
jgi:glycerophosphoryl diester phosphodiesterase